MRNLRRLIILIIAAVLGTVYYQRFHAVSNIAEGGQDKAQYRSYNTSPIGQVGGLGPVTHQKRSLQRQPRQRPVRH